MRLWSKCLFDLVITDAGMRSLRLRSGQALRLRSTIRLRIVLFAQDDRRYVITH